MDQKENRQERAARLAREMSAMIRREAGRRWAGVRMAERNERGRHVWRFRTDDGGELRYLHVPHETLAGSDTSARTVFGQLVEARWLERFEEGPEASLVLSRGGTLEPWSQD